MEEQNKKFETPNEDVFAKVESTEKPITVSKKTIETTENPNTISFDEMETTEEKNITRDTTVKAEEPTKPEMTEEGIDYEVGSLSDEDILEVKLKEEDKDKVFEIESVELLAPILKDVEGNFIPPKPFNPLKPDSKVGYKTKLMLKIKDTNYVCYIPNVKWFPGVDRNTGKKVLNPWFGIKDLNEENIKSKFTPEITKLYYKLCKFLNIEPGKMNQQVFVDTLPGMKFKPEQYAEEYNGKMTYRIDIKEFVSEEAIPEETQQIKQ